MNMISSIILEGNIEKWSHDPEYNQGILIVSNIRKYEKGDGTFEDEVSYFDVITYGQMCAAVDKAVSSMKVKCARAVGRLKQKTWTDEHGLKHSKVVLIAEHVEFKPCAKQLAE